MGKVIRFPAKVQHSFANHSSAPVPSQEHYSKPDPNLSPMLSSPEEDLAFLAMVLEWPCFSAIEEDMTLEDLFELYYEDELTLAQDCVLEFIFHMHDPQSAFDVGNALYTWSEDDRNFFILSLNMHSELIDQLKREEC